MSNKKPEEFTCPECGELDWILPKKNYFLIESSLCVLLYSIFPILKNVFNGKSVNTTFSGSMTGVHIYECNNCGYQKFYKGKNTTEDLKKKADELHEKTGADIPSFSKSDDKNND